MTLRIILGIILCLFGLFSSIDHAGRKNTYKVYRVCYYLLSVLFFGTLLKAIYMLATVID